MKIFVQMMLIVAFSAVLGGVNAAYHKMPWQVDMKARAERAEFQTRFGVDLARFRSLYENEGAIVIDARTAAEFAAGHLDAIDILNVPEGQVHAQAARLGPEVLGGRTIVLYCGSRECDAAENVFKELQQLFSYEGMSIFVDGWEGIRTAGLPVVAGPERLTTIVAPAADAAPLPEGAVKPNGQTSWTIFGHLARVAVAGLFLLAAYGKLVEPQEFAKEIGAYRLAPVEMHNAMAIVIPPLELVAAVLLVVGFWRPAARGLLLGMLVAFTAAKLIVFAQGRVLDCGCFGKNPFLSSLFNGPMGLVLNLVLIGLLIVDWYSCRATSAPRARVSVEPAALESAAAR